MKSYNIQDVVTLEEIYKKMRPWMRHHPNVAVFKNNEEMLCNKCGSNRLHRRGFAHTNVGRFQRFQCQNCGGWSRTRYTELPVENRKVLLNNVVN